VILSNGTQRVLAPQAFAELSPQFYNSYFVPRTGLDLRRRSPRTRSCIGASHG